MGCLNITYRNNFEYLKVSFRKELSSKNSVQKGYEALELTNHLNNVLVVVTDRKLIVNDDITNQFKNFESDLVSYSNYYPFGARIENLSANSTGRYGFQGQEKDDEIKGENRSINYKYRMYDPWLCRFPSVDPLTRSYPHYTPYSFSGNRVIDAIELEGLEEKVIILSKFYEGGKRVIDISTAKSVSELRTNRDYWSNTYVNYDGAWEVNSNQGAFKRTQVDGSYMFKGTLTIDLRNGMAKASYTITENMMASTYIGPDNPSSFGKAMYDVFPQDAADAAARIHDQGYDRVDAAGIKGVFSETTIDADIQLVRAANKIIEMYNGGKTDPFTGNPISEKTKDRAVKISGAFTGILLNKVFDPNKFNSADKVLGFMNMLKDVKDMDLSKETKRDDFKK